MFDILLAIAYSRSWAMSLVEQIDRAALCVDISKVTCSPTELFLLSAVPAKDIGASTLHKSNSWYLHSLERRLDDPLDTSKIIFIHEKTGLDVDPIQYFDLKLYEDTSHDLGNVIAAVVDRETGVPLPYVYIMWVKTRLHVANQGYGLGGTYRYSGMKEVL